MMLDEAIAHACEIAECGGECAQDHEQLAEWLKELRGIVRCGDCTYCDKYPNDDVCVCYRFDNEQPIVNLNDFCSWGKRRESSDD